MAPFALILFLGVLFNLLFAAANYLAAKRRAAAREGIRASIREAIRITAFRRESFATTLLPCALITAAFCVPYAAIFLAVSAGPGVVRHSGLRQLGVLFPAALMVGVLAMVLKKRAKEQATALIVQHLRRAEYETALALTERSVRRDQYSARFLSLRGVILLLAGRLKEAEQALRGALETAHISVIQKRGSRVLRTGEEHFLMLENLGHVLLMQGRGREAAAAFEGAAKMQPRYWSPANGMAEVYLLHDREPQRALQYADQALNLRQANAGPNAERHTFAYIWANRARALALLGKTDEAQASLKYAAEDGDPDFVPGLAGTLWRTGKALLSMDRESEAMQHFQRAKEIDPTGLYGRLCAVALLEHGVRA
jgi:tetratricopeptide (TPR) repeat protein